MKLEELVQELNLEVLTPPLPDGRIVSQGYVSDLLSDVLGKAPDGALWVTLQCHPNVVAVAALLNLAAVLIVGGAEPDAAALAKAEEVDVVVLGTALSAFEVVGRLYELGLRG